MNIAKDSVDSYTLAELLHARIPLEKLIGKQELSSNNKKKKTVLSSKPAKSFEDNVQYDLPHVVMSVLILSLIHI